MKPKVSIEDRMELHELIARYAWALDTGDVEGYVDCFFEDGWIEHDPPGLCKGREAIRKLTEFLWYEHSANYLGRQHRMSQVLMSPEDGDVRVHLVIPKSFNDAQQIADKFKDSIPVILNLQSSDTDLSKRLIDFASGLTYALDGGMQRIADKVFMLTPRNVEISAEERARLIEKGFFNQS